MKIPFMDLSGSYPQIYDEVMLKIKKHIDNTRFIGGEDIKKFEKNFSEYCNAENTISCGNGTDALIISLKALGIGPGDTVITVPNTFIATGEAVTAVGAQVDFVDIEEKTYTMDPQKLKEYLHKNSNKKNIKAIIPVHIYGQMCDMERLMKIAEEYNLSVVEDSSQAHGAKFKGKGPGEYGDIATFSFYPGKNLGAFGDGGAIVCNDKELAEKIRKYANHGRVDKYTHQFEGYNSRLDSIQASVLDIKLKHLDGWNELRSKKAKYFSEKLKGVNCIIPYTDKDIYRHVYHLYVIQSDNRDELREFLKEKGISTGIHYPLPLHLQEAYKYLGYKEGDFPTTERIAKRIISLPFWPEIRYEEIDEVVNSIKLFLNNK
ncbi:DegT/DnrJ/EryC1/StrS family aminotransferase [Sporosalibacterium faouarense]|uniref:DegT/DnrJ/EryC1/StrS family aminotransferase n=1 Tax=Sporosalibacterium faouarense TaxID=516123 RepID=UPI00192AF9B8|nr:DegT/DnrJ/EryC1/StrS family aminotransferase [Sporosalibacterium faouarense]